MNESPRMNNAIDRLQRIASTNAPLGMRVNAEQEYSLAYEQLVRQGLRMKLRAKYRIR